MSGKQAAVMWLALGLVIVRGLTSGQFSSLWGTVSKPTTSTSTVSGSSAPNSSAENGSTGTISV